MRPKLEADLREQQAKRQFAELAETFSNSVYEQADTFKPVAEKLKLTIQQVQGLGRAPTPATAGVMANPKILEALFSEESISKRRNTAAIELGNNTLVSARIVNYRAAAVRPFGDVKESVRTQFMLEQAQALAKAEGQARLSAWKAQPAQAQVGNAVVVSRDQTQGQPQVVVDAALRADPSAMPALVGVDLGAQGYAVVRVNKLVPREEPNAQQQAQSREQFARLLGNAEAGAYLAHLRSQFKVEIKVNKPKGRAAS
jgi:peptidyl-prolyl cis-trans isomerase D